MRKSLIAAVLVIAACNPQSSSSAPAAKAGPLTTDNDKTFYALGLAEAKRLEVFSMKPEEIEQVKRGMADGFSGAKAEVELDKWGPKISELARNRFQEKAKAEQAKAQANLPVEKEKGKAYAEKAAAEKGAEKTASGMVYQELTAGTGAQPKATDRVKVHYKGTLIDGTEFDSSYSRNEPAEFPLNGVIPCWTEGVQKIKVGGKAKLVCPSDIAYGDSGRPPKIAGGATLVFEVELLEVKAAPEMAPAPGAMPPGHPAVPGGATPPPARPATPGNK